MLGFASMSSSQGVHPMAITPKLKTELVQSKMKKMYTLFTEFEHLSTLPLNNPYKDVFLGKKIRD